MEELPKGFTFQDSSLDSVAVRVDGQSVQFTLLGEAQFSYTPTASNEEGKYEFSGVFKDAGKVEEIVSGHFEILVSETPPPTPSATPTPTETPSPTPTVTIVPTPTTSPSLETTLASTPASTELPNATPTAAEELSGSPTPAATLEPEASPTPTPTVAMVSADTATTPAPTPTVSSATTATEAQPTVGEWLDSAIYVLVALVAFSSGVGAMYALMRIRAT